MNIVLAILAIMMMILAGIILYRNIKITAKLARMNKLIREQNTKLQEISEEKSNIVMVVSHDLKGPLNRIFALVNLMKISGVPLAKEQNEYLAKISQAVKEGLVLIKNLLDIRTIEKGEENINPESMDLVSFLSRVIRNHSGLAENKNIKLSFSPSQEKCEALTDRIYLERILENLLSNAIKFSPYGKEIRMNFTVDRGLAVIRVIDQGPGVNPEERKLLFQRFKPLGSKPTGGESSTGLGLSIVYSLIHLLRGEIHYEDNPEGGAVFVVKLPIDQPNR